MTKAESAEVDDMYEEVNSACKSFGQRTMSYLLKSYFLICCIVKTHQVGAVKAAHRLLGKKTVFPGNLDMLTLEK